MTDSVYRNQAEIERSSSEASKIVLAPFGASRFDRYMDPPADTIYPLEYAFYLLGDVHGKAVLDLGCGTGENTVALLKRGARVRAMDISPDLIAIAEKRLHEVNIEATLAVGDAYNTGLASESVDIVFCIALIHHLDLALVRDEMLRVLRRGGTVVLKEPIRFSGLYNRARGLLPEQDDVSDYEHPLTREEFRLFTQPFKMEGIRYFRLPFVPLASRLLPSRSDAAWRASDWAVKNLPFLERYASGVVVKLIKG